MILRKQSADYHHSSDPQSKKLRYLANSERGAAQMKARSLLRRKLDQSLAIDHQINQGQFKKQINHSSMVDMLEQENNSKNLQYEIAVYNSQLAQSKQSQVKLNMPKSTNNSSTNNAPF